MNKSLSKSPMQESVLHIRCDFSSIVCGTAETVIPKLTEVLSIANLAYDQPLFKTVPVQPKDDGSGSLLLPPPAQLRCGERFRSADSQRIVQIFADGVAISWLKPYDSWEKFVEFAFSVWDALAGLLSGDARVDRIGLRAINRITLPDGSRSIASRLVGRDLPAPISTLQREGFLACDTFVDPSTGARANVSRTFEPSQDAQGVSLMFDIDAFYLPRRLMPKNEIISSIENLHGLRDKIFFAEITNEAMEEFK